MRPIFHLLLPATLLIVWASPASAATIIHHTSSGSLAAGGSTDIVTLTNADLGGNGTLVIDTVITRSETSGGDSWFGAGLNAPGFPFVNNGNVGWLTRTRTDTTGSHQLFNTTSTVPGASVPAALFTSPTRTLATITLSDAGIGAGQTATAIVRHDHGNDGSFDTVQVGRFNWSGTSANLDLSALGKTHGYELTVASTDFASPLVGLDASGDLFNTGVDGTGTVLGDGTIGDPHYDLTAVPGGTTDIRVRQSSGGFPIGPWLGDNATSAWIGPNNANNLSSPGGNYTYETTFTIPRAADLNSAVLIGLTSNDNDLVNVLLNGVSVGGAGTTGFGSFADLFVLGDSGAFQHGTNTLQFLVNNAGAGPTGLRVDGLQVTFAVPEPGRAVLLLLGACAMVSRRRR